MDKMIFVLIAVLLPVLTVDLLFCFIIYLRIKWKRASLNNPNDPLIATKLQRVERMLPIVFGLVIFVTIALFAVVLLVLPKIS